jgi:hypothetical protein
VKHEPRLHAGAAREQKKVQEERKEHGNEHTGKQEKVQVQGHTRPVLEQGE